MPSRLFDQNHLPHSILKHTKSVIDSQYIMTTGLCEDHKYLGDKYQIPATEPQDITALDNFCAPCHAKKDFKAFHNARETIREDKEDALWADIQEEAGIYQVRIESPFVGDAELKYDTHLRALIIARIEWEKRKAEQRRPIPDDTCQRTPKVVFKLPENQRSEDEVRSEVFYFRRNRWYEPGKWSCTSSSGFWDTSGYGDSNWGEFVELEQTDDDSDEGYDGLEKSLDLEDLTVEVSTEAQLCEHLCNELAKQTSVAEQDLANALNYC